MKPLAWLALALAGGAVAASLSGDGDDDDDLPEVPPGELATGVYGRMKLHVRRHGGEGVAWSIDGEDLGTEADLRAALDIMLGTAAGRADADDAVALRIGEAMVITVQPDSDGWLWQAFNGTGMSASTPLKDALVGEGTTKTRGAALIAAMDALDLRSR